MSVACDTLISQVRGDFTQFSYDFLSPDLCHTTEFFIIKFHFADIRQQEHETCWRGSPKEFHNPAARLSALLGSSHQFIQHTAPIAPR